jgi:hypothetical protein
MTFGHRETMPVRVGRYWGKEGEEGESGGNVWGKVVP